MARAALAIQQLSVSTPILNTTFTAPNGAGAGNGNTVATGGAPGVLLVVKNTSGTGARTVTIVNSQSNKRAGVTLPSQTIIVAQSQIGFIHLGPGEYLDSSNNIDCDIDSLDAGNVTWAAIQIPSGGFQ